MKTYLKYCFILLSGVLISQVLAYNRKYLFRGAHLPPMNLSVPVTFFNQKKSTYTKEKSLSDWIPVVGDSGGTELKTREKLLFLEIDPLMILKTIFPDMVDASVSKALGISLKEFIADALVHKKKTVNVACVVHGVLKPAKMHGVVVRDAVMGLFDLDGVMQVIQKGFTPVKRLVVDTVRVLNDRMTAGFWSVVITKDSSGNDNVLMTYHLLINDAAIADFFLSLTQTTFNLDEIQQGMSLLHKTFKDDDKRVFDGFFSLLRVLLSE